MEADPDYRPAFIDPRRPPEAELRVGLAGEFTLALAGDCIASHPITPWRDRVPGLAGVMDLLAGADICCGNLETNLFDMAGFGGHPYCWDDDVPLLGGSNVARDLAALGFGMLARANNHALDWGIEGMRETSRHLDAAGIVHAGAGDTLGLARRAAYTEIAQGRVGLVSVATSFRPTTEAIRPQGATPGRPGVSAIRLRQIDILTADEMELLLQLRLGAGSQERERDSAGRVKLFGRHFEAGAARGYRHEMDPTDLADFLANVRHGKQNSDFLVVMIHAHEFGREGYPEPPSASLKALARAAIDAGADTVGVSGIHHLGPVDVYRERPVFYGLGDFIWGDIQEFLPSETLDLNRELANSAFAMPQRATAADLNNVTNAGYFAHDEVFETVVPIIRFDGPRFVDAVLHPVHLGYGDSLTRSGIPRLAEGEQADRILRRIRDASTAFGCEHRMEIADGVGILRTSSGNAPANSA